MATKRTAGDERKQRKVDQDKNYTAKSENQYKNTFGQKS